MSEMNARLEWRGYELLVNGRSRYRIARVRWNPIRNCWTASTDNKRYDTDSAAMRAVERHFGMGDGR